MSLSTSLRRAREVRGCATGSNWAGEEIIPASSADCQGWSFDAHVGRFALGVLSPQPPVDPSMAALGSYPRALPK